MQYWGTGRLGTVQSVAYTGTAGTIANGVALGTMKVRVCTTTDAFIKISNAPTATTSDVPMFAGLPEYFTINQGEKVSAIQSTASGTLTVVEMS